MTLDLISELYCDFNRSQVEIFYEWNQVCHLTPSLLSDCVLGNILEIIMIAFWVIVICILSHLERNTDALLLIPPI